MTRSRFRLLGLSPLAVFLVALPAYGDEPRGAEKVTVETLRSKPVTVTDRYFCQIRARRHITVRALSKGYVAEVTVKEDQGVKVGDVLFRLAPLLGAESAGPVSIKAPFDGTVGQIACKEGSLVKEGDDLTTLSDNDEMWVYFSLSEAGYLEYMDEQKGKKEGRAVGLVLSNGDKYPRLGKVGAIEGKFNERTGTIAFRADFPNPDGLLRHGQAGTVLLGKTLGDAIAVPQRAIFEMLDRRFVYAVDKDDVAHRREIAVAVEADDSFVVKKGLKAGDRIVVDGVRLVRDGEKVK